MLSVWDRCPTNGPGDKAPGASKLDTWHWGFVSRKFQFPQRGPGKSPYARFAFHAAQVHPLCTACPQWSLCPLVLQCVWHSCAPFCCMDLQPGSSSVPHLELAIASHHPPACAQVMAQPSYRLVLCVSFWGLCHQRKGDPVPLTGGTEPTSAPAGSCPLLWARVRTFTAVSVPTQDKISHT